MAEGDAPMTPAAETYCLVFDGRQMPRWCVARREPGSEALLWIDFKGRRLSGPVTLLAHVEGDTPACTLSGIEPDVARLAKDFAYEYLLDPWSDQGWLSPTGRFFGCGFFAHDELATMFLRKPVGALEAEGWARVHAESYQFPDPRGRGMSNAQYRTLEALGFQEGVHGRRGYVAADRSASPPAYAHAAPDDWSPPSGRHLPTLPVPKTARPRNRPWHADLPALLRRLAEAPAVGDALAGEGTRIRDTGGRWTWIVEFDRFSLGAEEEPGYLLASPGLRLSTTAFDQVEVNAWPVEGVMVDPEAERILAQSAPEPIGGMNA